MYFATNIANFLACGHIATLERREAAGENTRPYYADPGAELLRKLGMEHEQKYLNELKARGLRVVEIATDIPWSEAAKVTREAMARGAEAIYQATFVELGSDAMSEGGRNAGASRLRDLRNVSDGSTGSSGKDQQFQAIWGGMSGPSGDDESFKPIWGGRADFLLRVETPSELGPWSYEVVETKLAKSTKARALIQLCFYSELVAAIQGKVPERMHVVLGRGAEPEVFSVHRYLAYFRKILREFQSAITDTPNTYPEPVEHCAVCDWFTHCDEQWHADDHLSLVANITRNQRKALVQREVDTVARLATLTLPAIPKFERIAPAPLLRIREQARVQVRGRDERRPVYELINPDEAKDTLQRSGSTDEAPRGLAALPSPSPGDLFLDFEGDPFAFDLGLEYLIGTVTIAGEGAQVTRNENIGSEVRARPNGSPVYEAIWSFNPTQEKKSFEKFIETVMERRRLYPDMHIYHYAPYEPTAIKHLAGRHNVCAAEVDELLRAEVFVDLYRIVRQGLRASVESYSIKKMEPFYKFTRAVPLRDATSALQSFEAVLALGDNPEKVGPILQTIADYNRDDCLSTWRLREWLEELRLELEVQLGTSIPRPELKSGAPSEDLEARLTEIAILKERLVHGLPEEESDWSDEQRACWLMAQLLEWHRREDKSIWWEYYRLCDLSDGELIEDRNALGGLVYQGVVEETKHSLIHRYQFPFQDHAIDRAREVHDPRTRNSAGTIVKIDEAGLTLDLKRGKRSDKPHPTSLIPLEAVKSEHQVASLIRIANSIAEKGIDNRSRQYQSARDALLRRKPRFDGIDLVSTTRELPPLEAAKKLALALDGSILPIQGPPGSGKTYTGAQMILELLKAGKRVGITAGSHKVISNLLSSVCKAAEEDQRELCIVQKANEDDGCEHKFVIQADDNPEVLEKLQSGEAQVAAGTAWLWSREEFAGSIDVLFVDEAGQMSLANVLAISPAAKSVVLLGDPQQLDQPQKGVHPPGAEVSALSHLLNERATIEPHQGLFLSESWRLHPDICAFTSEVFYDGRLQARAENARQRLNATGQLDGTGLRFMPVIHNGNQSDSPEEVEAIAALVEGLLRDRATWTNEKGQTVPLALNDILIVAPYNAQVAFHSYLLECRRQ